MPRDEEYRQAISYLYGLQRVGIKFGLENITRLLKAIGDPHKKLRVVHIGGSNGKGSTAAHLQSILMKAGLRTGLYTSPHLVSFTERIRINGGCITEDQVCELTERILHAAPELREGSAGADEGLPITFFEFTTAMAMAYFETEEVDLAILEVGMGGRLDATNVCEPLVSIITTISLEHQEYLGRTLEQIAREKAGIIKPHVPVLSSVIHPRAREVISRRCRQVDAPLYHLGRDFQVRGKRSDFYYQGFRWRLRGLRTSLRGNHQVRNAALAIAAAELLDGMGYNISPKLIREALEEVRWRGRQEWHPGPPPLLLDGAHNPEAIRSLCSSISQDYMYRRLRVLMGVMREKDYKRMIRSMAPLAHEFVFCRPRMDRAQDPWLLRAEAVRLGCRATVVEEVSQGLQDLMKRAARDDLICVTGSLFTVGEAISWLEGQGDVAGHGCSL
jgi:dihydrofolate synthase/folylpolyglutamate synthase